MKILKAILLTPVILGSLFISCSSKEHVDISTTSEIEIRKSNDTLKIKDWGDYAAIFEQTTGDFVFCYLCNASFTLPDIIIVGEVNYDFFNATVNIKDISGQIDFVLYVPISGRPINTSAFGTNTVFHPVDYLGVSGNVVPGFYNDPYFSWIPADWEDIQEMVSCECVPTTSSPCGANGMGYGVEGCDIGGDNSLATGCGVTNGASAFGTGMTDGCSINCPADISYPCCNY